MPTPRVLILRAPGTNCDRETAFAFERAGGKADICHVRRMLESPAAFGEYQILCIPGGFSYGDDLGAGRIFGNQLQHHLVEELARFKSDGKLILGICNGFQVLMKTGLLTGTDGDAGPPATLTLNDSGRYEDRWVRLGVGVANCVFLQGISSMYLPVAHAEGKFVVRDGEVFHRLHQQAQLALRYLPADDSAVVRDDEALMPSVPYPANPNGAMGDVAGLCDTTGRVLGLMPHPERHIDPTHHPRWTRGEAAPAGDGLQLFLNAVRYFG
ncbi:MAG: phosphoribosylformylglycinamidine synthase subunit PurQ [Planctomycetota bacterium]